MRKRKIKFSDDSLARAAAEVEAVISDGGEWVFTLRRWDTTNGHREVGCYLFTVIAGALVAHDMNRQVAALCDLELTAFHDAVIVTGKGFNAANEVATRIARALARSPFRYVSI